MKYIKILTDSDFNLEVKEFNNPRTRLGARGIVLNENGKIAILNKQVKNEYKLVGGGIDEGEEPKEAFKREVLEETGCEIEIVKFLGLIKEEKSQDNFMQTSYVYVGKVINDTKKFSFTEKEIDEGAQLLWLDINEALDKIKECEDGLKPSNYENVYHTKFVVRRDYTILKYYLDNNE